MSTETSLLSPPTDDAYGVTRYEKKTGKIIGSLWGDPVQVDANKERSTDPFVNGIFSPETHYVSKGVPVEREEQKTWLRGASLTALPPHATIRINSKEYTVNDSTVELSFDQPGTYKVLVVSWPYLDKEFIYENPTQ